MCVSRSLELCGLSCCLRLLLDCFPCLGSHVSFANPEVPVTTATAGAKLVTCVKAEPSPSELQALTSPSSGGPKSEAGRVDFMRRVFDRGLAACEHGA